VSQSAIVWARWTARLTLPRRCQQPSAQTIVHSNSQAAEVPRTNLVGPLNRSRRPALMMRRNAGCTCRVRCYFLFDRPTGRLPIPPTPCRPA
jgi:hypothetical protein